MPDFLKRITEQITAFWNKLSTKNKVQIITAVAIVVIALGVLTFILSQPNLVKYASGLSPEVMNEIQPLLDDNGISYEIRDNATTLYVDSKKQQEVTLLTEPLGLLSDSEMTWDEALTNSITATSQEKQVKYQLAFEEELNNKIETLDSIKNAYVKLDVAQEDSTIFDENKLSSATVIVETSQNLDEDQIQGIVNFLKNAVSNLDPSNISLMTTQGKLLYDGGSESGLSGNISSKLDYEYNREQGVEASVRSILLAGGEYDDATVTVDLVIDFDEKSVVSEEPVGINGGNAGVITHDYESESAGTNTDAAGVPGTDTNATDYMTESGTSSENSSTVKETEYEPGKIVTSETKNVGDIVYENSSVSVILNKYVSYDQALLEASNGLGGLSWDEFKSQNDVRTKIDAIDEDVVNLVKNASKIENIAVMAYTVPMFIDAPETSNPIVNYIPVIIIVLLMLLLGYAVYKGTTPQVEVTEVEPELSVEELLVSTKEKQELNTIEFDDKSETRVQIEKFVSDNPDAVALLLRNWLNEDWE